MMETNGTPAYGRRLIPMVLDELAEKDPDRVYAAIPKTSDVKDGYQDVSVADLACCVDFMAKWLEDKFGRSNSFETITYIGLSDLRGPATLLAAIKTGHKLLLPSPRNPPSTNLSLMHQTGSTKLLYPAELAPMIKPLQSMASSSISSNAVPSFQEMLESNPEPYIYQKNFDEARDDPIVVLHSSGSTGLPKPITCTHGSWAAHDNEHNLPAPAGRTKTDSTVFKFDSEARLYVMLPFFHLGGFVFFMHHAICNTVSLVLGPPQVAPDAVVLREIAQQQKLRGIMVIPALLEQLLHDPTGMELIKSLEFVACAGAPLPAAVGDQIKDVVKLFIFIGSTETFPLPELSRAPDDWLYHEFNPNLKHEMQLYDPNVDTYELVIFADESTKDTTPLYHNLPGIGTYYTKDLFTQHPEKPGLFKYYGRKDDILVLANGEKVNPIPLEQHVQGHPSVKGVIVIGNGMIQSALLVEPKESPSNEAERADFIEMLWPRINESNTYIPGQGRVARDKVICVLPNKPFPRTGKGTIIRKMTEEAYKDEIERLYSNSLTPNDPSITVDLNPVLKTVYEPAKIVSFLRQVLTVSFVPVTTIGEDEDFFAHGLDSVQTLEITANLKRNLKRQASKQSVAWISPRTIFRNSTLADLSKLLAAFLNEGIVPKVEDSQLDRSYAVDEAVARHVKDLPDKPAASRAVAVAAPATQTSTVALVGSTGYLGSYLVATLLRNPEVLQIYCLNRSRDAQERQTKTLDSLDKALGPFLHKLAYIKITLGEPLLGLNQDQYDLLSSKVDVIVYNSWRLDFGLALRSFEPFLRTTRDLVELSAASRQHNNNEMRIVFISSMSAVEGLATKATGATVPEALVEDALAAMNTGYGQSKLAAERILVAANRQSGMPVSIVRVGQVGGPSSSRGSTAGGGGGGDGGAWADQPWISAIIRTSVTLGCFPNPVVPIDWVPVDTVASMVQSFILQPAREEPQVYNVAAAAEKAQPWSFLIDVLRELGVVRGTTEVIPLRDWVKKLRNISDARSPQDLAHDWPALKMLDFYETLGDGADSLSYATSRAKEVSGVEIHAVDKELLAAWLKDWNL